MLKCGLDDDRDLCPEILIHQTEEKVCDQSIGVGRKLVVFDAEGVDVALFNLIAADHRQP